MRTGLVSLGRPRWLFGLGGRFRVALGGRFRGVGQFGGFLVGGLFGQAEGPQLRRMFRIFPTCFFPIRQGLLVLFLQQVDVAQPQQDLPVGVGRLGDRDQYGNFPLTQDGVVVSSTERKVFALKRKPNGKSQLKYLL